MIIFNSNRAFLTAIFAGIAVSIATVNMLYLLIWISIAPLFLIISHCKSKIVFWAGIIFGFVLGFFIYFWMIGGIGHYTGDAIIYGILVFIVSCFLLGIYFGIAMLLSKKMWNNAFHSRSKYFLNRLSIAALWTVLEYILSIVLDAFPMHVFRLGFAMSANIFFIQLTAFGGLSLFTFLSILINIFVADLISQKKPLFLVYSVIVLITSFGFGAITYYSFTPELVKKPFKVAIVSDNTSPETKWNKENGNVLANNYFRLCKNAIAQNPDFVVWPESTLPWNYAPNDDLLQELLKISNENNPTHVIGMNTETESGKKFCNSVYYLNSKKGFLGIYDKQILLKGIEEPLGNFLVPFGSRMGLILSKGKHQVPIHTLFGKAGTLVCNEIVIEKSAASQVRNGANFFFNLSNDGWFSNTYLSLHHLFYARIMAVENRKDISIANNCGYNGIINSKGNIVELEKETKGITLFGTIYPNQNRSFYNQFPYLFPTIFTMIILTQIFYLLTKTKKNMI